MSLCDLYSSNELFSRDETNGAFIHSNKDQDDGEFDNKLDIDEGSVMSVRGNIF